MPLSEHEQRLLAEMEKQLNDDPQFADSVRRAESAGRFSTRNVALGLLIAVVGLALVLVGVAVSRVPVLGIVVGVVGFGLMCFGVYLAFAKRATGSGSGSSSATPKRGGYMQRLEQQWEDRFRDGR